MNNRLNGMRRSETLKQSSAASVPLAFDRPILVVIVTLLKMALRVALATGHGTNRKHRATLSLFEIRDQGEVAGCVKTRGSAF